jgi:hypothetical protein
VFGCSQEALVSSLFLRGQLGVGICWQQQQEQQQQQQEQEELPHHPPELLIY